MRFIILGAGAVGCYVGARFAHAGHTVCFVGRPRVLQPLAALGLQISGTDGLDTLIPPAQISLMESLQDAVSVLASQPAKPGAGEYTLVVLVCVKTTATDSVAQDIAAHCPVATDSEGLTTS
jgi:2-dehydropantoate 2-reductase